MGIRDNPFGPAIRPPRDSNIFLDREQFARSFKLTTMNCLLFAVLFDSVGCTEHLTDSAIAGEYSVSGDWLKLKIDFAKQDRKSVV